MFTEKLKKKKSNTYFLQWLATCGNIGEFS